MIVDSPGVWFASAVVLGSAAAVCTAGEPRRAVISLWLGQLAGGSILLSAGAETLAVLLWNASTLVAAVYFFHSDLLGVGVSVAVNGPSRSPLARSFHALASIGVGVVVWWLLELATAGTTVAEGTGASPIRGPTDFDERFVLVELLAGVALAAAIATGVITRAGGVERNPDIGGGP